MRRIFSKIQIAKFILATFDLTMDHFQYLTTCLGSILNCLQFRNMKEVLPKIRFFGNIRRFHPKWDKILEILTFNSARMLKLTYAPRSAAFIHLPFIAGIFQPQDIPGKFAKKEENRSVLIFANCIFILCSLVLSQRSKTNLSVGKKVF